VIQSLTGGRPVNVLINSSAHFDHAGLNADFRTQQGVQIIAHWREGAILAEEQACEDLLGFVEPTPPFPPEGYPRVKLSGRSPRRTLMASTAEVSSPGICSQ
jgi:glyoxylase-like metal-dependent hydrolase (beta-lactamase superfamily II)